MNQQSLDLIELCAEPGRARVPSNTFRLFIDEFIASGSRTNLDGKLGKHVHRAYFVADQKPSFNKILSMCFAHGVGIKDVLLRPQESASPGLFPISPSSASAQLAIRSHLTADRLASVVADLTWFRAAGYVPKPWAFLRAIDSPILSFLTLPKATRNQYLACSEDQDCAWADAADDALRHAVKKLCRAIATDSISKCMTDFSADRRYRKILESKGLLTFALAAARIALHLGNVTGVRAGNLEALFRPYALAITAQLTKR